MDKEFGKILSTYEYDKFKKIKGDFVIVVPSKSYDEYIRQWSIFADHIIPDNI